MNKAVNNPAHIVEGIAGTWRYHLAASPGAAKAFCGVAVMRTHLPIERWGVVTHLKERYCTKCETAVGIT